MPPKDTPKKPATLISRPPISDSSLLCIPADAVEGFKERIEMGIDWTNIALATRHHRSKYQKEEIPTMTFSQALQNKIKKSILNGFLDETSSLSLDEHWELLLPITLWDIAKFANEEGQICFHSINCITEDIDKLIKKAVKFGNRDLLKEELRQVSILRVNDAEMTELDSGLADFTKLVTLNLCGNFIGDIDASVLPPGLRTLELQCNWITQTLTFAEHLPVDLLHLGLARNLLTNESLEGLPRLPHQLTVLDLSENDIYDLYAVLEALGRLPYLKALSLAGNPCSVCMGYAPVTTWRLPRLSWLDSREVLSTDRPSDGFEPHPDDVRSSYFNFTVFRIMSAPQPPKPEKGAVTTFHVELELPLLDATRRGFLMFRRNESLKEMQPPPEDEPWPKVPSVIADSKIAMDSTDEASTHESDVYKHLTTKNSREICHFTTFESNRVQWNKLMNFQEPVIRIFCPDLTALRDTFRTVVTLRLIYSVTTSGKQAKDKKSVTAMKAGSGEQRVVLATIKCTLQTPDWSQPSQHFHWDDSLDTNEAIHWGDGDLSGTPREQWGNQVEYLLSCLGYAVGIGNVWRFPYLCYKNGGGAFLIPYFLTLIICGIPLVYLETTLGQFASAGCISVFNMNPLFKGAGYAVIILIVIALTYFSTIMALPILYMYHSLTSPLPWQHCGNPWNTEKCTEISGNSSIFNSNGSVTTPEDEFFHIRLLRMSPSISDIGGIVWPVFWCNLIGWIIVYFCICNGVKSVGKIVYFTVLFPYVVLCVLFIRGVTLPGAWQGILFYVWPEWHQLGNPRVWADAATQIFYSLGPGWGGLVSMASFNRFNYDNLRPSVTIALVNSGTSIWAGFVVFSMLGFAANRTGVPVGQVATAGPGLAFITYPAVVTMMPAANFWALTFFVMLFFLGIDSMFVTIEAMIAGVIDEFPQLRQRKRWVTLITCLMLFSLSIICNTEGGFHVLTLLDAHVAIAAVPVVCLLEIIAAVYTYGASNLSFDVRFMTGRPLKRFWLVVWRYIVPPVLIVVTAYTMRGASGLAGWCVALVSVMCIPAHAVRVIYQSRGSFMQRVRENCRPSKEWGPVDPDIRQRWVTARKHEKTKKQAISQIECYAHEQAV